MDFVLSRRAALAAAALAMGQRGGAFAAPGVGFATHD